MTQKLADIIPLYVELVCPAEDERRAHENHDLGDQQDPNVTRGALSEAIQAELARKWEPARLLELQQYRERRRVLAYFRARSEPGPDRGNSAGNSSARWELDGG